MRQASATETLSIIETICRILSIGHRSDARCLEIVAPIRLHSTAVSIFGREPYLGSRAHGSRETTSFHSHGQVLEHFDRAKFYNFRSYLLCNLSENLSVG